MEVWKQIKDYPDYEISNLGIVKSLKYEKQRILKKGIDTYGYYYVILSKNGIQKNIKVHKLVAIAFLNHTICGYKLVVNHKNFIRTDNRVENLEITTQRENTNQKHLKSSSKFTGVTWHKKNKKWQSSIQVNGKTKYLGQFDIEIEASNAYQKILITIIN